MTYYDTIEEDIKRAKEILERGRAEVVEYAISEIGVGSVTIYGGDIYAAYKLLESFVPIIEAILMKTKKCNTCKQEKEVAMFTRDTRRADGWSSTCRACSKLQDKHR